MPKRGDPAHWRDEPRSGEGQVQGTGRDAELVAIDQRLPWRPYTSSEEHESKPLRTHGSAWCANPPSACY